MSTQLTITAFKWVPPFAQGQVRDLRLRWMLKEALAEQYADFKRYGPEDMGWDTSLAEDSDA